MLGLRTSLYYVDDLEKAKNWYSQAFKTKPYYDTAYYVGFNIGGYELGLHPVEKPIARGNGQYAYWGVNDIRKTLDHLVSLGALIHDEIQNVGGDIETAAVKDPWDNIIGIIYNPEFKAEKG